MEELQNKIKEKLQYKIKKEVSGIKREMRNKIVGYITAAFGLIAGLAWNDAIKSLIEYFFPQGANSIWLKFVYAVVITLLVVIVSVYMMKVLEDEKK